MEKVREAQKKYCSRAMMAAIAIGFLFMLAGYLPITKGLILGTLFSVLNFVLIGETLPFRIGKTKGKTFFISLGSILFRYALLAIPLFLAVKFKQFNLIAAVCGLFAVQIVILADHLFAMLLSPQRKQLF